MIRERIMTKFLSKRKLKILLIFILVNSKVEINSYFHRNFLRKSKKTIIKSQIVSRLVIKR